MPIDAIINPGDSGITAWAEAVATAVNGFNGDFAPIGGSGYVLKPAGDTAAGAIEWRNDGASGYLMHLLLGATSGTGTAAIGIGTDAGSGGGILISHKNAGTGLYLGHNPAATGAGFHVEGYSTANYAGRYDLYQSVRPILIYARRGAGFPDGVTTNGSATLTSATATFTGADVGKVVSQLTATGTVPSGTIPGGTTIASVTNATTVVMSQPATSTETGVQFFVGDRAHPDYQNLFEILTHTQYQNVMQFRRDGESNPMFYMQENGSFNWGAGGANARDVNLFRQSNGQLGTDHQFIAGQGIATKLFSGAGKTTVADGDYARTPEDGAIAVVRNSTDSTAKIAVRVNGSWKYVAIV